jgi:SAM-dependent methyltransferase
MSATLDERAVETARGYDRWFERVWGRYAWHVESQALRRAVGATAAAVAIDVGCGTGRSTQAVATAASHVTGVDRSQAMLTVARQRHVTPVIAADAHALPLRDGSVDLAVAVTVLEFVADPEAVIAELARVVRPAGRIVIGLLNTRSPWGLAHRRDFRSPPWDTARFLSRDHIRRLGAPHGRVRVIGALFAPGELPVLRGLGAVCEFAGRAIPSLGAFRVLIVDRS